LNKSKLHSTTLWVNFGLLNPKINPQKKTKFINISFIISPWFILFSPRLRINFFYQQYNNYFSKLHLYHFQTRVMQEFSPFGSWCQVLIPIWKRLLCFEVNISLFFLAFEINSSIFLLLLFDSCCPCTVYYCYMAEIRREKLHTERWGLTISTSQLILFQHYTQLLHYLLWHYIPGNCWPILLRGINSNWFGPMLERVLKIWKFIKKTIHKSNILHWKMLKMDNIIYITVNNWCVKRV